LKNKTTESIKVEKLQSITCDKCKTKYSVDDWMEVQEFHTIDFVGGYGSVFGDCTRVQCDLCQHCFNNMIKDIASFS
jgi:hypothetical protein